jgi:hypothetical protein
MSAAVAATARIVAVVRMPVMVAMVMVMVMMTMMMVVIVRPIEIQACEKGLLFAPTFDGSTHQPNQNDQHDKHQTTQKQ